MHIRSTWNQSIPPSAVRGGSRWFALKTIFSPAPITTTASVRDLFESEERSGNHGRSPSCSAARRSARWTLSSAPPSAPYRWSIASLLMHRVRRAFVRKAISIAFLRLKLSICSTIACFTRIRSCVPSTAGLRSSALGEEVVKIPSNRLTSAWSGRPASAAGRRAPAGGRGRSPRRRGRPGSLRGRRSR